jgi:RNA polymerase sigma-70 factor (ECF subfamily)
MIEWMTDRASDAVDPALPAPGSHVALAAQAARGDRAALATLLGDHARAVHELCFHVAGASDARDAAQEALERIVVGIGQFDAARGPFKTWALGITRNVCRDRMRRRGLERATFEDDGDPHTEAARSTAPDPERMALARADARQLALALETLPENLRTAVVLFHVHESTYEEIAATMNVPMGTVMTWLHRARKRLRVALEDTAATAVIARGEST